MKQIIAMKMDLGGLEGRAASPPALTPHAGEVREWVKGLVALGEA